MSYNKLLFYQGKTARLLSGFHVGGIQANSPQLIDAIDAYPIQVKNQIKIMALKLIFHW